MAHEASAGQLDGRSLCGAVRFTARPRAVEMDVCHCGMCRRWTGGVFMGVECGTSVEVEDPQTLGVYVSSEHAERVFCRTCGSSLFWRMRDGSVTAVSAQAFDDPATFPFEKEIFVEEQPDNYRFAGERVRMTGVEAIAAFAGEGDAGA